MKFFIFSIAICIITLLLVMHDARMVNTQCDTCRMCGDNITMGVEGIYYVDKYYCVWTDGKTYKEINKTEYHEVCHALVREDKKHFCG